MTGLRGGASGQSHSMIRPGERPDGADPLPVRLSGDHLAGGPGLDGEPDLVVLDVIAADIADRGYASVGEHPAGELAQRAVSSISTPGRQERTQLPQVAAHHDGDPVRI